MAQSSQAKTATKTTPHFTDNECALMGCKGSTHPIDALNASLTKSEAISSLLAIALTEGGDTLAPSLIGEVVWISEGLAQQARAIADRLVIA